MFTSGTEGCETTGSEEAEASEKPDADSAAAGKSTATADCLVAGGFAAVADSLIIEDVVDAEATTSRTGRTVQSCEFGVGYGDDDASGRATKLRKMLASPHATNVTVL
jgi:hypothetical protein